MRAALLVLAGSTSCVAALHVTTTATVTSDSIAPPFTLTAQDGRSVSLARELAHGPSRSCFIAATGDRGASTSSASWPVTTKRSAHAA